MDKKEARKILGVTRETSKNEIERKYYILLKKHRQIMLQNRYAEPEQSEDQDSIAGNTAAGSPASGLSDSTSEASPQESERASAIPAAEAEREFDLITQAYNVLMGYEVKVKEEAPGKAAPLLNKIGVDEKKAKNFFYYYKYHILGAIILIISLIYFVSSCANRVKYDFNTAFVGRIYYYEASDALKDSIKQNIPIIQEPGFDGAYIDDETAGQQQYAMEMKATILFAASDIDVFILDRNCYERYAKQGAFMNLDEIAPSLGVDVSKYQDLILAIEEDDDTVDIVGIDGGENGLQSGDDTGAGGSNDTNKVAQGEQGGDLAGQEHLYGIDVSDSKVLKDAGIIAEDMIAAIFVSCRQQEKAEAFLEYLLK